MAVGKRTGMDGTIVVVLSDLDGIFTFKEEQKQALTRVLLNTTVNSG